MGLSIIMRGKLLIGRGNFLRGRVKGVRLSGVRDTFVVALKSCIAADRTALARTGVRNNSINGCRVRA